MLGAVIFVLLTTWKRGSGLVAEQRRQIDLPMDGFLAAPQPDAPRVSGTAVYLTSDPSIVPSALFHNLKHCKVMHEQTVFLCVVNEDVPYVADADRIRLTRLAPSIFRLDVRFGFREEPDLPPVLARVGALGLDLDPMDVVLRRAGDHSRRPRRHAEMAPGAVLVDDPPGRWRVTSGCPRTRSSSWGRRSCFQSKDPCVASVVDAGDCPRDFDFGAAAPGS